MTKSHATMVLALALTLPTMASALPPPGSPMPAFSVDDIAGNHHTERDLRGQWTVAMILTDKDVADDITAWSRRLEAVVRSPARLYRFGALNLFPLLPTAPMISRARESTPRHRWNTVWFSRDGSFASALGLPEEEMPWVVVINPEGRVALTLHERVSEQGVQRILAALPAPPPAEPALAP
ncbi:MAG: hypothetical protein IPF99_33320 [Deltaproteobacteria bacterium]|nr:hypothetical protein [Deltaproteobacteria bacterium]MBK7068370.1 hypothetical protein [Deltaproteobacteria bacterium]